ncbi:agmatinase [compost metagenome]
MLEIIQALAKRSQGNIVGMDLVEVAPVYDPSGMTSILAAQLLLNSIGFIFHERAKVRAAESEATPA